jgi:hypothetical protein
MASSKKTQFMDALSVREIYARGANNTTLPPDQILVTDGQGGTVWQDTGALQGGGAFTTINTTPSTIVARVSAPFISLLNGPNAGFTVDPTAPNTLKMFANAFNQLNIQSIATGQSTLLSAYDNPTNTYKLMTFPNGKLLISASLTACALPNKASATTKGPMVVPKEFTPPPRLTRVAPVSGSPNEIANGCAAVCCSEKPRATMKSPSSMPGKLFPFTAKIIASAPNAENSNPYTMLFL